MIFVNKEGESFRWRKFFPQNLLPDVFAFVFFLICHQNSNELFPDLVQDDI